MRDTPRVQAYDVTYELHTLGWKAFQDLCISIVSEILGQTVQSFLPSRDGGRDGAFTGVWKSDGVGGKNGTYTVQCKFTSKPSGNLSWSLLQDEISKAKRLAERGLSKNYILMTNLGLSGLAAEEIEEEILKIPGIEWSKVFGSTWIIQKIRENSRLRMLVPRVYGLGDLSQILDERSYEQAKEILEVIGKDLSKFVVTDAHLRSVHAIKKHGFVLLLGEPASGKSMIAATLSLGAHDIWNSSTLKITDAQDFVRHRNPHEPQQFFWVDDVFGTTQYQKETVFEWNKVFQHLDSAIKKGARVLFTSRDYIYKSALKDIKMLDFPLLAESQVIINVHELTLEEKQQILYNHIKLGDQPKEFRRVVKPFLDEIALNKRFLPEIARRLGSKAFTKNLSISTPSIKRFVEHPLDFLIEVVGTLDADSKAALAVLFMRGGILESPIEFSEKEEISVKRLGSSLSGIREALSALRGSFTLLVSGHNYSWRFKHPTISDAIGEIVANDTDLVDIYLSGTPPLKLIQEITCGDMGIEGVKVKVPGSRYMAVMDSIETINQTIVNDKSLYSFLEYRCDIDFLKEYLIRYPKFLEMISSLPLSRIGQSGVTLLVRLNELGMLPEQYRAVFANEMAMVTVTTPHSGFLTDKRIRAVFKPEEVNELLEKIKMQLLPQISGRINDQLVLYDPEKDPEDYFAFFIEALKGFAKLYNAKDKVQGLINEALEEIDKTIEDLRSEYGYGYDYYEDEYPHGSAINTSHGSRSIFDDVDE